MGPFELDDVLWEKFLQHINNTAQERGKGGDTGAMLLMIKEFYHIVDDKIKLDGALNTVELTRLEVLDADADAAAVVRKTRITELKRQVKSATTQRN